ncbi:MAG: hypothetical protein SFU98_18335 [Leptospiraceae bacterium]|nr:hypothetical protein [Leptospiraceae bacterium]
MAILFYLVVLVLVDDRPHEIKIQDFDNFAMKAKLSNSVGCKEFLKSESSESSIRKSFKLEPGSKIQPVCLTPDELESRLKKFIKK